MRADACATVDGANERPALDYLERVPRGRDLAQLEPALYISRVLTKMSREGVVCEARARAQMEGGTLEQRRGQVDADEAVVPELVDRLEYQAAELTKLEEELATLRAEREKLLTELAIANRWVRSLAHEVELADAQLKEMRPLYSRIGRPLRPASN